VKIHPSSLPTHIYTVPSSVTSNEMERHVQVSNEVNDEFEGFLCKFYIADFAVDIIEENIGRVINASQNVDVWSPHPTLRTWEQTLIRGMVSYSTDIM